MGYTNFAFCVADTIVDNASGKTRGMFETKTFGRIAEATDVLSMTIFMSGARGGLGIVLQIGQASLLDVALNSKAESAKLRVVSLCKCNEFIEPR